jgi:CheY-like chemotaxis protein
MLPSEYFDLEAFYRKKFKARPVLIVEDNPAMVATLSLFVRKLFPSHFVKIVSGHDKFSELIATNQLKFDAIIVDPGLSERSTYEERLDIARLALACSNPQAPAVILTGLEVVEEEEEYHKMGYTKYVKKRLIAGADLATFFSENSITSKPQLLTYGDCVSECRLTLLAEIQDLCFRAFISEPLTKTRFILEKINVKTQNYHAALKGALNALEKTNGYE